jgi:hypothetical protein
LNILFICSPTRRLIFPDQTIFQFDTDEVTTILLYKHHKMPTTFCFLFFCWNGLHDAHKYSLRAHCQNMFFVVTFLLKSGVCVMECGASQKGRRCFFVVDGKGKTKLNRRNTEKKKSNGAVLSVVEWGCKSK